MIRCAGPQADGLWAMPSARALLVAPLLTEPPFGCLGPSGNDRYRKRSETVGLRKSAAKSLLLFRNEAVSRRARAGAIGGSAAMTRTALRCKSPLLPRAWWLGRWVLGISSQENAMAGRRDKRGSPVEPQAIDMAWVTACRSVGARAAPCILINAIKGVFGTMCAFDCWGALP